MLTAPIDAWAAHQTLRASTSSSNPHADRAARMTLGSMASSILDTRGAGHEVSIGT
jgi:hypothetical protein